MTDEALIRSTLAGDDQSFAELVRRHKGKVFGIASRFANDSHNLDDIAQEIFIRVWRNLAKFRADAPFEHWLARIAVHACYDFLRKKQRAGNLVPLEERDGDLPDGSNRDAAEARETLEFAMRKLSPEERLVITLTGLEGKSVSEVAQLTGWSETNVKVRNFRARQTLKKILEKTHER
jgi:RNA polymerase sigma-70 factor (ECF subfamily)